MDPQMNVPELDTDRRMKELGREVSPEGQQERRIVAALIDHLFHAGFLVRSVFDSEEQTPATTAKDAMEVIFNLDEAVVAFARAEAPKKMRTVLLVCGNGTDIITDWSYGIGDPDGFDAAMNEFDAEKFA